MLGPVTYRSALRLRADPNYLHLSVARWFRFGHSAMSIPWNEVAVSTTASSIHYVQMVSLSFHREPEVPLQLTLHTARKLVGPSAQNFVLDIDDG